MSMQGPVGHENLNIAFKLQSKAQLFNVSNGGFSNVKLDIVATASQHGLVFIGSSNAELIAVCLKDLEFASSLEHSPPVRKISLPSPTTQIATNCDASILAVDVKINGIPHIQLYSVPSFLKPDIQKLREFRISQDNSSSSQIYWNPVMNNILAICTESGGLNAYTLKEATMDFHSIDPNEKAKCCCWSPKGKQIVAGFANGKLIQFKPDLKPAKIIECPDGIVAGTFDTIAVQWLSTYQFAVAFLGRQEGCVPVFHIVNAPKAGPSHYIAYVDVCYSQLEQRPSRIYFLHIIQWNMLLVASANCIDVSFLTTKETGDAPTWTQEYPNDQFPAELPLSATKDETFPTGLELETGCVNRLKTEEGAAHPPMPMIHILSTDGSLCSFYVLNTTPGTDDICSPPRPLDPIVANFFKAQTPATQAQIQQQEVIRTPPKPELIMTAPMGSSTPAPTKVTTFNKPPPLLPPTSFSGFSLGSNTSSTLLPFAQSAFQNVPPKTTAPLLPTPQPVIQSQAPSIKTQAPPTALISVAPTALISVPPTYTPSTNQKMPEPSGDQSDDLKSKPTEEDQAVYAMMIKDEIATFSIEMKHLMEKSRSLKISIGTKEESAEMRRSIEEMDELKKEATETIESMRSDVQSNRLGLTEMFSMLYETRAKCDQSKNQKSIFMNQNPLQDRASKRTLDKLTKMIAQCEMQLQCCVQLINSQWSNYQDASRKNKKNLMHNPSLEGLYQTLTKQQEIIYRQHEKMARLKTKLGLRDDGMKLKASNNSVMESLSDSIISMSLADQIETEASKLTDKKLKNLRNLLAGREVAIIKPQRPIRSGLNSEIIREKKINAMNKLKKPQQVPALIQPPAQQKVQSFTPVVTQQTPAPQPLFGMQKKSDEQPKSTGFSGFNAPVPQPAKPSFGLSFGSNATPSFGLSSTPLVLDAGKRKEEAIGIQQQQPLKLLLNQQKPSVEASKPSTTIANANIAVSASFSIPLSSKATPNTTKEPSKPVEKKSEDVKIPSTNESTSFTFKIPDKSATSAKIPVTSATPAFETSIFKSSSSDTPKPSFSFDAGSVFGTKQSEAKTAQVITTTSSIFSGFGSTALSFGSPATSTTSATTSIFGGSVSTPSFSSFGGSGFALNLTSDSKPTTTVESSTGASFSFAAPLPTTKDETKAKEVASSIPVTTSMPTTTSSISEPGTLTKTFSFSNFGTSLVPQTTSSLPVTVTSTADVVSTSTILTATANEKLNTENILGGLNICSPEETTKSIEKSSGSIFGSTTQFAPVPKADTTSIFGASTQITSTSSTTVVTTPSSIFGTAQSPPTSTTPSMFGALSMNSSEATKATSPPTGLFASLAKPDQSVFGQTAVTSSSQAPASPFGGNVFGSNVAQSSPSTNIFGSTNTFGSPSTTQSSNIFGSVPVAATQSSVFGQAGTGVFGQSSTSGSIFGQTSAFGAQDTTQSPFASPNVFGGGGVSTQQTGGSLFGGQTSFGSQPTATAGSIFGGTQPAASGSVFGSSSVFGGSSTIQQQPAFGSSAFSNAFSGGSSIAQSGFGSPSTGSAFGNSVFGQTAAPQFGGAPTFGGTATFGSPKSNIFGSPAAVSPGQSNLFEQLGSSSGGNLFGSLAQNTQPVQQPQQQQQPPTAGFGGSAFSSWR